MEKEKQGEIEVEHRSIPVMGRCDSCLELFDGLNRVYHFYRGLKCNCHSPEHFDVWDICDKCRVNDPSQEMYDTVRDNLAIDKSFYLNKVS